MFEANQVDVGKGAERLEQWQEGSVEGGDSDGREHHGK